VRQRGAAAHREDAGARFSPAAARRQGSGAAAAASPRARAPTSQSGCLGVQNQDALDALLRAQSHALLPAAETTAVSGGRLLFLAGDLTRAERRQACTLTPTLRWCLSGPSGAQP